MEDDIYIRALPLLQNAASYKTELTPEINQMLKETYVALGDYRSYIDFLTILMSEKNPSADVFSEAAEYYLDNNKFKEAIAVLVDGISKTNDAGLIDLYEENRYRYITQSVRFEDLTDFHHGTIQVSNNGLWGIANYMGNIIIPCTYDKISTMDTNSAGEYNVVVKSDDIIYAVDNKNRLQMVMPL